MKHNDIIARMTLEQKCALLSGCTEFTTRSYPELGIPELRFSDGPSGLRKQAGAADHLGLNPSEPATCFPSSSTIANSWDVGMARLEGAAMGAEAASLGVNVLLGPGMNIKRNPLCGRNFEYYSEDPLLTGDLAAAFINGIQSQGIAACPKHLALNNQETRRMTSDSVVDERTFRELYLAGFERAVRKGRPRAVMSSYNLINGVYANENESLLRQILCEEWGFDGAVVTDWGGSNDHVAGVRAGSTFEMPTSGASSILELVRAVRDGRLEEAALDERVDEALDLILSTDPAVREAADSAPDPASSSPKVDGHHRLARDLAAQCAVLLKNEDDLLPLAAGSRVAVIGDFARAPRYQGAGSSAVNALQVDTVLSAIGETGLERVGFARGFDRSGKADVELVDAACKLAAHADVVLLCLGLTEAQESEGADREDMRLPDDQVALLRSVAQVNPRTVVLLSAGSPIEVPWLADAQALLLLGLGGEAGASAALDVVTGTVCPSGKLAETWPVRYADVPNAANYPATGRHALYREGLFVGYRFFDTAGEGVSFPFGFGLSYASFLYEDPRLCRCAADGVPEEISLTVANTGDVAAAEVVQVYIARLFPGVFGPEQQLAGFVKVTVKAGEARRVTVPVDRRAFSYWNVATGAWEIEDGPYEVRVAASSRDIRARLRADVAGTGASDPYEGIDLTPYRTGDVRAVSDSVFERLLGRALSEEQVSIDRNTMLGELGYGRSPLGWLAGAVINTLYRRSKDAGKPDLNIAFARSMPLRALAKMTGGRVSMGMVDAIVMELRGWLIVGVARLAAESVLNAVSSRRLERLLASAATTQRDGNA